MSGWADQAWQTTKPYDSEPRWDSPTLMISAIANSILEQLQKEHPKDYTFIRHPPIYVDDGMPFFSIEWSEQVAGGELFTPSTYRMAIDFYEDCTKLHAVTKTLFTTFYCDPEFPDNLVNHLKQLNEICR